MSTEGGRLLLHDLVNHKKTGFSPWGENIGTKAHWKSRPQFQEVSYSAFRIQAQKMAEIARAQTPIHERPDKETKTKPTKTKPTKNTTTKAKKKSKEQDLNLDFEKMILGDRKKARSLRDPINEVYPTKDRIFLLFELDGDIEDEDSNQFEISEDGMVVNRWGRVPKERLQALKLIRGSGVASTEFTFIDADCVIVDVTIQKRMKNIKVDENGDYWERRDMEELAFPCRSSFYNKVGREVDSYIFDRNKFGYTWGCFWLVGTHVGAKPQKSR